MNQKLLYILYSSVPVLFSELIELIGSIRIEQDIKTAELINRLRVNENYENHEKQYYTLLTEFAFYAYHEESHHNVEFFDIDGRIGLCGSAPQRIWLQQTPAIVSFSRLWCCYAAILWHLDSIMNNRCLSDLSAKKDGSNRK